MKESQKTYRSKSLLLAKICIGIFVFLGVFGKFIANELPLIASDNEGIHLPAFRSQLDDWGLLSYDGYRSDSDEWSIMPPIPYSGSQLNSRDAARLSPLDEQSALGWRYRHWLGTDQLGRDVLAGIVDGCAIALKVGFFAVFLALILGVYVGLISGYFGDKGYKISPTSLILGALIKYLAIYYMIFPVVSAASGMYYFIIFIIAALLLLLVLKYEPSISNKKVTLPVDLIATKIIEVMNSIPSLFIILALLAIIPKSSITHVIWIIAILYWPTFARYVRGETLQIKAMDYIRAAQSSGMSDWYIMGKHILPNALTSTVAISIFMICGAILLESTLSFLGIGIPVEQVSWGSMLSAARDDLNAWWLALFPGLCIFLVLISLYTIANRYQTSRLRQ